MSDYNPNITKKILYPGTGEQLEFTPGSKVPKSIDNFALRIIIFVIFAVVLAEISCLLD